MQSGIVLFGPAGPPCPRVHAVHPSAGRGQIRSCVSSGGRYNMPALGPWKDSIMTKNKRVAFYIPEEWWKGLSALAGTFGVSAEEVIRQSLPDDAVDRPVLPVPASTSPTCGGTEVGQGGPGGDSRAAAGRVHEGAPGARRPAGREPGILRRGGRSSQEAGSGRAPGRRRRTARSIRSTRPEEDSVYLGCLYEAWKRAKAGRPGYAIAEVDVPQTPADGPRKAWAVLKDNQIV